MIRELSILIPCHNDLCLPQVKELQLCASAIDGLQYEIIVSDDASTNQEIIQQNTEIEEIEKILMIAVEGNFYGNFIFIIDFSAKRDIAEGFQSGFVFFSFFE